MAKFNLRPPRRRVNHYCTVSTPHHTYRNLLNDLTITHPHQVWCSDLRRLVYRGTIWYLATIEDLAARQIIAANIGKRHDSQLVLATLHQAFATRQRPGDLSLRPGHRIHGPAVHRHPRSAWCAHLGQRRGVTLAERFHESFYGRFKQELGDLDRFASAGEIIEAIYRQIHYYNHRRIHTALKLPPAVYAARTFSDTGLQVLGT